MGDPVIPLVRMCVDCGERPATPRYLRCSRCRRPPAPPAPPRPVNRRLQSDSQRRRVLKAYGLTAEQYDGMLLEQGGGCALCGVPPEVGGGRPDEFGRRSLFVDHDHATGRVRALLCLRCNSGIGQLNDDPALMRAAADYVERFRENAPPAT